MVIAKPDPLTRPQMLQTPTHPHVDTPIRTYTHVHAHAAKQSRGKRRNHQHAHTLHFRAFTNTSAAAALALLSACLRFMLLAHDNRISPGRRSGRVVSEASRRVQHNKSGTLPEVQAAGSHRCGRLLYPYPCAIDEEAATYKLRALLQRKRPVLRSPCNLIGARLCLAIEVAESPSLSCPVQTRVFTLRLLWACMFGMRSKGTASSPKWTRAS